MGNLCKYLYFDLEQSRGFPMFLDLFMYVGMHHNGSHD